MLIGVLVGCASGRLKLGQTDGGEVVEAEGWSPVDSSDPVGTKNRALIEAQKKAVEKVVGVYISAKTRVSEAVAVNQNILANVSGYVGKYEIRSEREEEGFHKTVIRALVRYEKVGKDLDKLGLIRPDAPPGNPKIHVALDADDAAGAVRRSLLAKGFSVVEAPDKDSADIVLRGSAQVYRLDIRDMNLGGFHSYRSRVSLEAYNPKTEAVIVVKSMEASGLDPSPGIAKKKALDAAGGLTAEKLAEELYALLSKRVDVRLQVKGLPDLNSVQGLVVALRTQPDIAMVTLASFGEKGADITVKTEGFAGEELAEILKGMKRYPMAITSVAPYLVQARSGK